MKKTSLFSFFLDISISWVITETGGGPVSRQRNKPLESPLKANTYRKLVHRDNKNLRFVLLALKEGREGAGRRETHLFWPLRVFRGAHEMCSIVSWLKKKTVDIKL